MQGAPLLAVLAPPPKIRALLRIKTMTTTKKMKRRSMCCQAPPTQAPLVDVVTTTTLVANHSTKTPMLFFLPLFSFFSPELGNQLSS
jgi:hypothetical protein